MDTRPGVRETDDMAGTTEDGRARAAEHARRALHRRLRELDIIPSDTEDRPASRG
jgi:hypothetical protein